MKSMAAVTIFLAAISACNVKCVNKMDSSFFLTNLDATYTLEIAPGCNADFTLTGTAVPKSGPTGKINVFVAVKGADCTIVSTNGTGADKVIVQKKPSGKCTVKVPFQA